MVMNRSHKRERRRVPRNGAATVAYVEAPGKDRCRCPVINSSPGGALIDWGCDDVPLGPHVLLVLVHIQDQVAKTVRRRAVVLRRSGNRLGLKFVSMFRI
jgi:hypothetical protein